MASIHFFYEAVDFTLVSPEKTKRWIKKIAMGENKKIKGLNFIFCTDEYLHTINKSFLKHDTYTDIITFNNIDENATGEIEGDIFISIERVEENARIFKKSFTEEVLRVIAHGVLHLIGFDDKSDEEKQEMRIKENSYLSLYKF